MFDDNNLMNSLLAVVLTYNLPRSQQFINEMYFSNIYCRPSSRLRALNSVKVCILCLPLQSAGGLPQEVDDVNT